jgi:8-oxo-dGTP diphosphatase
VCWGGCPGKDSNLHAVTHQILSLACLPIPPPGHQNSLYKGTKNHYNITMKNAALAIVLSPSNSLLLVQRSDVPVWVLPGGGIDPHESPEVAAIRETYEESGLTVEVIEHIATYQPVNRLARTTHLFLCRSRSSEEPTSYDHEVVAARFFPLHGLPPTLFPLHRTFVDEWRSAQSLPIHRQLTEVTYTALIRLFISHPWWVLRYLWTRHKHRS